MRGGLGPQSAGCLPGDLVSGRRHTPETRRRIAHGVRRANERRAQAARLYASDARDLANGARVRPELRPFLAAGAEETAAVVEALGGPDALTPQRRLLADDLGRLGALLRALVALFAQDPDPEVASRVATLAGARRQNLAALGLDRAEREVPDLRTYLERAARANGGAPDPQDPPAEDRPADASEEPAEDPEATP